MQHAGKDAETDSEALPLDTLLVPSYVDFATMALLVLLHCAVALPPEHGVHQVCFCHNVNLLSDIDHPNTVQAYELARHSHT